MSAAHTSRWLVITTVLLALAVVPSKAAAQGRWNGDDRHDNGRHNGWYTQDRDRGDWRAPYRDPALDRGYRDGYARGLDDGRDGDRFDPVRDKRYRKADAGYYRGYGPHERYRDHYRDGFVRGYEDGYRAARPVYRGRPAPGGGFFFGWRF